MGELTTYLFPAIQALFGILIGIVWLIGFFRRRNLGFLLLGFVALAEAVTTIVRQAAINYVIYHQPYASASARTQLWEPLAW